jgi:hypothetical protein
MSREMDKELQKEVNKNPQLIVEKQEKNMKSEVMTAVRKSAMTTLSKGADLAFKTTVVVLTLKFLGILQ